MLFFSLNRYSISKSYNMIVLKILNAVELSGIWDVQWEKPQPIESLRIFLIIPSLYFFSSPTLKLVKAFHLPFVRATHLLTAFSRSTLGLFSSFTSDFSRFFHFLRSRFILQKSFSCVEREVIHAFAKHISSLMARRDRVHSRGKRKF